MIALLVVLICVFVPVLWIFSGARVQVAMKRRCVACDKYGDRLCTYGYGRGDDSHGLGTIMGYIFGPFMLVLVYALELGDGTTLRRFREWNKAHSSKQTTSQ